MLGGIVWWIRSVPQGAWSLLGGTSSQVRGDYKPSWVLERRSRPLSSPGVWVEVTVLGLGFPEPLLLSSLFSRGVVWLRRQNGRER